MEAMAKEAKEIQSDLYSLKRLYGLVKTGSSNTGNDVPLDGNARLLLKNLLDTATKRVLKIVTRQGEAPEAVSPAEQHQPTELSKEKPIPFQNYSTTADHGDRVQKELGFETDRKLDRYNIPLWKDKSFVRQLSQTSAVEQPIQNMLASGPEYGTRRCRVCRRNSIKHLETKEGKQLYSSNSFSDHHGLNSNLKTGLSPVHHKDELKNQTQRNLSGTEQRGFPSDMIATDYTKARWSGNEAATKPQEVDFLSKEASKAIEQIESGISAFHLVADPLHLFEGRAVQPLDCVHKSKSQGPAPQTQFGAVQNLNMNQNDEKYMGSNNWYISRVEESARQTLQQVPCAATEETYPPYFSMSQTSNLVQPTNAMWEQSIRSNFISYPATYPSVSGVRYPCQSHMGVEDDNRGYRLFQPYIPTDSIMSLNESENIRFVDPDVNIGSASGAHCRSYPPKVIGAPSQLSLRPGFHKHQHDMGGLYKGGISRERNCRNETKVALPYRESDVTTDSYTSDGRSQQTTSLYSATENEEYSLPDNSRDTEYVTSRTSSETGTRGLYTSYTSNSTGQSYYSSTCGGAAPEVSFSCSSSRSDECSSKDQPINYHAGATKKSYRGWTHRSSVNRKQQRGVWKRLKDKLAVIFHHHHHHHHHHNYDDRGNDGKMINRSVSLQKQKREEVKAERAVEKTRKSLIPNKNQQSHFRGLMGGFLRHVRESKKFKQGKETAVQMAKIQQNSRKKALEKPDCCQLLQQHQGAKLPKKIPLNLELGKRKTHLKALPKLK